MTGAMMMQMRKQRERSDPNLDAANSMKPPCYLSLSLNPRADSAIPHAKTLGICETQSFTRNPIEGFWMRGPAMPARFALLGVVLPEKGCFRL